MEFDKTSNNQADGSAPGNPDNIVLAASSNHCFNLVYLNSPHLGHNYTLEQEGIYSTYIYIYVCV